MMSKEGHPDLVSGPTDTWWRLVRKGVSVTFSPANIRRAFSRRSVHEHYMLLQSCSKFVN